MNIIDARLGRDDLTEMSLNVSIALKICWGKYGRSLGAASVSWSS